MTLITPGAITDLDHVLRAKTILELDDRLTRHVYGFDTVTEYYDSQSCKHVLEHVKTPLLCLNSRDDPFFGDLPIQQCVDNPHIVLAITDQVPISLSLSLSLPHCLG